MDDIEERRASQTLRKPVSTLVEICGNEPGIPAFEAQSVDVSGQGMHLRTAFVPDVGDPLVCRFEEAGNEIVVEGVVAWRQEHHEGGEFGIQFTALDSRSVEALRALCSGGPACEAARSDGSIEQPEVTELGTKVRLHIDGLAAPMKARVRDSHGATLKVGSNLEFLRVGRRLEIEDLARTNRRSAYIDSVTVAINPSTRVPELMVTLRYDGAHESTPEPSVIDFCESSSQLPEAQMKAAGPSIQTATSTDFAPLDRQTTAGADGQEASAELTARLNRAREQAAHVAKATGTVLARCGTVAARQVGRAVSGSSSRLMSLLARRSKEQPIRRTTAPPPAGAVSIQPRRLRRQADPKRAGSEQPPTSAAKRWRPSRRASIGVAAGVLVLAVGVFAFSGSSAPPNAKQVASEEARIAPTAAGAGPASSAAAETSPKSSIVADVPLFGPTPMATMEPAPLGPSQDTQAGDDEDEEAREKAEAQKSLVADERFEKPQATPPPVATRQKTPASNDVKPWGNGRMHLPTIYRLRLSEPGASLQGNATSTGFVVKLPGRKVMESARAIEQRDRRIARVRIKNGPAGAEVAFQFKSGVPSYRVRLRKDFVEFLISAPQKGR